MRKKGQDVFEDGLLKPTKYAADPVDLGCRASDVLKAVPSAANELYLWYSGFYMGMVAPEGGKFQKTCEAINAAYGHCVDNVSAPFYRVDKLDLPGDMTTGKPITSWSRAEDGARHFYDYFTNGVNRMGSDKYGWRIISSHLPQPLVTYEATMEFAKDCCPDLLEWVYDESMIKSQEVICLTPKHIPDLTIRQAMPAIPIGKRERERLIENRMREAFGIKLLPPLPLGEE